jgi:archaellum component FlaC
MATLNELENEIKSTKEKLDKVSKDLKTTKSKKAKPISRFVFEIDGRRVNVSELNKEQEKLSKQLKDLQKLYSPYEDASKKQKDTLEKLKTLGERRQFLRDTYKSSNLRPTQLKRVEEEIAKLEKTLPAVSSDVEKFKQATFSFRAEQTTGTPSPRADLPSGVTAGAAPGAITSPEGITTTGGTGAGTGTGGVGGTGGTGGVALTPQEKAKKRQDRIGQRFEKAAAEFRKMAPQYAWILDIDQSKYPDVRKLVQRAIKGEMFKSPEGIQRFIGELEGTTFFNELREKGTKQKIVNLVGDLGFDEANLGKLLANSSNLQWDDDTLTREVYKEAFRKNADGSYVHSQAQARAIKSNDYLSIQNIGRAFFNQLTDDTVQRVLIGELNPVDVTRQQRELAKGKYGHLADLLEQGLSMEEITNSYRDQAARLLERDVNDVNMGDATYQAAYDFVDESGQKRLMTTGEWARKLRTDTQYGWDKTENAKREAQQLSSSIIQAFGRVM